MILENIKGRLHKACISLIEQKLDRLTSELVMIQSSANEETKSSAGDKYETGRAMLMLEKEKLITQQVQLVNQLKSLQMIDPTKKMDTVELGALLTTSNGAYFIASSLGAVSLDEKQYFVVSAMAPIAQQFLGKPAGESIVFNGKKIEIQEVI